ncbi:MAG: methyltransferase [Actinomyces urogenitalis]|uniref:Methyltransferase domain-containing protein n=2 Tax=Actinomyces urogenitalis TaxID=103621 RepID=A0A2I1KVT1_9ACTO|nr:methyltransferase [Actinomyces urogenitalis]ETJ02953.1 MAG: putative 16S rRNA methyltransferase [Actinomyces urogenitalis DORA_12]MBS5976399.1 methyltransferase [Actinomyces urogenitalis]MDK8834486.1 methyltransferase [Actinomyces urogenitalis]MDU0971684.1 methyltransferase [Actinomyces urogenitalis]MDU6150704.1 methyltransferase [Actinomyces urogenitalis]
MSEHYFTASPAVPAQEQSHRFTIRGREHEVVTASGVFSGSRLDKGTQVLLDHVPDPPETGTFLDLGCGWGPITLALADAAPQAHVLAADVNERSLELTARNAAAAGHHQVRAVQAEELLAELRETGQRLDLIWSNPPVRIGKEALHELLGTWLGLLAEDGEAWLVVGKNLGADSLTRWMADQGYTVSKEASSKGFRVLRVRR